MSLHNCNLQKYLPYAMITVAWNSCSLKSNFMKTTCKPSLPRYPNDCAHFIGNLSASVRAMLWLIGSSLIQVTKL